MSGLLAALHRLEGRPLPDDVELAPSEPVATEPSADDAMENASSSLDAATEVATALIAACPASALVVFVGMGIVDSITPQLREVAEAVVRNVGCDVALLGPGLLDDPTALASQRLALRNRGAYGFLHASSEYVLAHVEALREIDGVLPVVELGRTTERDVARLCAKLTAEGIPLIGVVVVSEID